MAARLAEYSMYILFALALLPLAILDGHSLVYFLIHPAALQDRDAALEVLAVAMAIRFAAYLLVPAALLAIFVFVAGSREARRHAAILVVAFCLWLGLLSIGGRFAFNSWGRVYSESLPLFLLLLLTVVLLLRRLRSAKTAP